MADDKIAEFIVEAIYSKLPTETYEIFLNEKEQLRWRTYDDGQEVIFDKEPQTTWGDRFKVGLVRILPIRGQL